MSYVYFKNSDLYNKYSIIAPENVSKVGTVVKNFGRCCAFFLRRKRKKKCAEKKIAPKAQKMTNLMFKDGNKFRRRRKEIYVFLNFDLKNVDFGAKFN